MSDKINKDIIDNDDDFFAKFDETTEDTEDLKKEDDSYAAESGDEEFSFGSASNFRNKKKEKKKAQDEAVRSERSTTIAKAKDKASRKSKKQKKTSSFVSEGTMKDKFSDTTRFASDKAKSAGRKAKVASKKAKEASIKAKEVAVSSKFGGTAAGYINRVANKPETRGKSIVKMIISLCLICVFAVGIYVGLIFIKSPAINTDNIYSQISQRSVMYDCNGKEIENLFFSEGNRTVIKYKDMPQDAVHAIIAIEDQKFESHHGFNFIRMIGAIKDSVFGGGGISGTSTVTQQLARNVYLSEIKSQRSISRKLTEMYCTIVLEKELDKDQIMEAYLNTVYFGFNSYGIEAAAESYFGVDAKDLTLEQCAALAALPQSPDTYALVYSDYYHTATTLPKIKKTDSVTYLYNGDLTKDRRDLVLNNMSDMGFITAQQRDTAKAKNLKNEINIKDAANANKSSYFTDYAIDKIIDDIMKEYNLSETEAENMVYTKGLKIYTSMDSKVQNIMEEEFDDDNNFTTIGYTRTNVDGNITSDSGVVLAYKYSNYFDDNDTFTLKKNEYKKNSNGDLTLYKGKRLNFFKTESATGNDISVEFKGLYKVDDNGEFYFIESGALAIPQQYKSFDDNGNCVISSQFMSDYPNFFEKSGGDYRVSKDNYSLKQKVRQPQASAVIIENKTGEVKGMMGGRGSTGKQLYNRAVHPRQPGSSIKPIAVYGPALQMSYEYHEDDKSLGLDKSDGSDWGRYITAGSVVNDSITRDGNGKVWPKNDDGRYHGPQYVREALQQSLNVCSYKIFQQIDRNEGAQYCIDMLKKSGITTLDEQADLNPAALSLGGLTQGLTPLEEAAAYSVFPNKGVYKTPIFYTKILNVNNEVLLKNKTKEKQVYDSGVAWIMCDVLRSVVTNGIGYSASISSQPAAGKTGTTSNMYDIWFSGFTPQYSMALWMGNDINMPVSNYSYKAAGFWAAIMGRVCEDIPYGSYFDMPSNVVRIGGEYYTEGTYSRVTKKRTKKKTSTKHKKTTAPVTTTVTQPPTTTTTTAPTTTTTEVSPPPGP